MESFKLKEVEVKLGDDDFIVVEIEGKSSKLTPSELRELASLLFNASTFHEVTQVAKEVAKKKKEMEEQLGVDIEKLVSDLKESVLSSDQDKGSAEQ